MRSLPMKKTPEDTQPLADAPKSSASSKQPLNKRGLFAAMFRKKSFYISLSIIIPVIFTGLSVLSFFIAYYLTSAGMDFTGKSSDTLRIWVALIAGLTFSVALFISRLILKPVEQFVSQAEQLPEIQAHISEEAEPKARDELARFTMVFNQLSSILSKVEARQQFPGIVGESKVMRGVLSQVLKVAPTEATVLITGESGTGKEVIARTIHEHSRRKDKPFVKINCAAIPDALLESELYGHEKGAFTGAVATKKGKFEVADQGTILLDEIGDMPLALQAKMLRVLEEKELERVGGIQTIKVDVRFLAATNQNLEELMLKGKFRGDLFYRLNVVNLHLPPLRYRKDDIPLLADFFLERLGFRQKLSQEALRKLTGHDWPGNVRELQNAVERAAVICDENVILPNHFPLADNDALSPIELPAELGKDNLPSPDLDAYLAEVEKKMLIQALKKTGGVQVRAAELLGVKERSLWHRLKKHQIAAAEYKTTLR